MSSEEICNLTDGGSRTINFRSGKFSKYGRIGRAEEKLELEFEFDDHALRLQSNWMAVEEVDNKLSEKL